MANNYDLNYELLKLTTSIVHLLTKRFDINAITRTLIKS